MNADRLRAFLRRRPAGADRLQLTAETVLGLSPIAEWQKEEIEAGLGEGGGPDPVAAMFEACGDHANAEQSPQKFLFRWLASSHDRPLSVAGHRAIPTEKAVKEDGQATPGVVDPLIAALLSDRRELLNHLATREKNLSMLSAAYERMLGLLSAQMEGALRREADASIARAAVPAPKPPREPSAEEREEIMARVSALRAATEKLPDIIDLGLAALSTRLLPAAEKPGIQ